MRIIGRYMTDQNSEGDGNEVTGTIKFGLIILGILVLGIMVVVGYTSIVSLQPIAEGNISAGEAVDVVTYDYEENERALRLRVDDSGDQMVTEVVMSNDSIETRQRHDIHFTDGCRAIYQTIDLSISGGLGSI